MNKHLRIVLRAGERIFLNGAVIKADRKVGLELMNDVVFLLEQHVMKAEEATSPLRQLYFMIQMMLMDPALHMKARSMASESIASQLNIFSDSEILAGLQQVEQHLAADRPLDALKKIRSLFVVEDRKLSNAAQPEAKEREVA